MAVNANIAAYTGATALRPSWLRGDPDLKRGAPGDSRWYAKVSQIPGRVGTHIQKSEQKPGPSPKTLINETVIN